MPRSWVLPSPTVLAPLGPDLLEQTHINDIHDHKQSNWGSKWRLHWCSCRTSLNLDRIWAVAHHIPSVCMFF